MFEGNVIAEEDELPSAVLAQNVPDVATLTVTFNGTEYSCPRRDDGVVGNYGYGAPRVGGNLDFSNYPFAIDYYGDKNTTYLYTPLQGTYALKIESSQDGVIYNESVTAKARGYYEFEDLIISDKPSIKVTLDGAEYICPQVCKEEDEGAVYYYYGGYDCSTSDFSEYPFCIGVADYGDSDYTWLYVESSGEYSLKIEELAEIVNTSECFDKAVQSLLGYKCTGENEILTEETLANGDNSLSYTQAITADSIILTVDGNEYLLKRNKQYYSSSETDYTIASYGDANYINNLPAGSHQIKIETRISMQVTSPCLEALLKSVPSDTTSKFVITFEDAGGSSMTADHTFAELVGADNSGKVIEAMYEYSGDVTLYTMSFINIDSHAIFTHLNAGSTSIEVNKIELNADGTAERHTTTK